LDSLRVRASNHRRPPDADFEFDVHWPFSFFALLEEEHMTDEALVTCFEAAEDPPGGFHHREHVRVAWWYLRQHSWPEALGRFSAGLQRYADARGATGLYHETITTAYVLLIDERLEGEGRGLSWEQFAARHPDLLTHRPSILERFYRPETLMSERARCTFVMPDRVAPGARSTELVRFSQYEGNPGVRK
jgi:hypothetical protein